MKQAPERDGSEPLGRFVFTYVTKKGERKLRSACVSACGLPVMMCLCVRNGKFGSQMPKETDPNAEKLFDGYKFE